MPRKSREDAEGSIQHVWAHAIRNEPLFVDAVDRRLYLDLTQQTVVEARWRLLAYCQMSTHVHLLVETPQGNLSDGMESLHGQYAKLFNRRHKFRGHLFERRFGSQRQHTDAQLKVTAAYIVNNPVAAKMVDRPHEWKWCSHGDVVNGMAPPWLDAERLLGFFGANGGDPLERYREFVEERIR